MINLQDEIMDFLIDLQTHDIIFISNGDEASEIGKQIWDILKGKEQ